ncbi:hypothetical protein [Verrucosispora sioxanthis]|uniref:hypothetical protein n=1 Tax=Verrucosispora sioxanthis TaxID=2499994 RepID=UPI001C0F4FBD|nr:hypothetical protein [Verrucosispora sioxanthis]
MRPGRHPHHRTVEVVLDGGDGDEWHVGRRIGQLDAHPVRTVQRVQGDGAGGRVDVGGVG